MQLPQGILTCFNESMNGPIQEAVDISNEEDFLIWSLPKPLKLDRISCPTTILIKISNQDAYYRGQLLHILNMLQISREILPLYDRYRPASWRQFSDVDLSSNNAVVFIKGLVAVDRPPKIEATETPQAFKYKNEEDLFDVMPEELKNRESDLLIDLAVHGFGFQSLPKTEQDALIKSRLGQGRFRKDVISLWSSCCITGLSDLYLLRASHIKPWKSSDNDERLDPYNGLLLSPHYDVLFDRGFVTFEDSGKIKISSRLSEKSRKCLGMADNCCLSAVPHETIKYLEHHRREVFKK